MSIEEIVVKGTKPKTGDEYYSRAMMGGANIYAGGREHSKYQIVERGVAPPIAVSYTHLTLPTKA